MNRDYYQALGYIYTGYRDILKVGSLELAPNSSVKVTAVCDRCGKPRRVCRSDYTALCRSCATRDEKRCAKISAAHIERCKDPEELRRKSEAQKRRWTPEACEAFSQYMKALLQKPEIRAHYEVKSWKRFRGETNPKYNHGLTPEQRHIQRKNPEYYAWRKAVYERDNFICQVCGQRGGHLNAHHVFNFRDYPDLQLVVENGICLCKSCHNEFHRIYGKRFNGYLQLEEFRDAKRKQLASVA